MEVKTIRTTFDSPFNPEDVASDLKYYMAQGARLGLIRETRHKVGVILIGKNYYEVIVYKSLANGKTELVRKKVYAPLRNARVKIYEQT